MAHISEKKKNTVAEFSDLIAKYDIIAAVNMENLPARTVTSMREKLRGTVELKMTKRRLLNVALAQSDKPGIQELSKHLKGMPALIFTNENPFTLFKTLKKNKSNAAIKGGQTAPNDIVVPAGPTSFAPGPVIGELGAVGIKAGIDGGKVAIKQDSVVAKEGEEVSAKLAALLTRLGIEPMEIGLSLTAVYENGEILTKAVLDIDEDQYIADITQAASWAFNLAVNSAIPNATTIEVLLQKAFTESKNLAINSDILTDITVGDTLVKAHGHMLGVARQLPAEALSEELQAVLSAAPVSAPAATAAPEQKDEDNNKPEEKKEDTGAAAAGLGALFG
jgi:large subunit ribosomal protein L10